jgi:peptidoglycan/LPS O-acetylase OafA/YrhL
VFYVGNGCLLAGFMALKLPSWRLVKMSACVGSHSYSIYLWHAGAQQWVALFLTRIVLRTDNWFIGSATYLASSILLGILMALAIEFPVLKLRDRWFPSRSKAL